MFLLPFLIINSYSAAVRKIRRHKRVDDTLPDDFGFDKPNPFADDSPKDRNFGGSFPNTEVRADGSRVCRPGYVSDGTIDKRGCWQCVSCDSVSVCQYPGICAARIPKITKYKNRQENNVVIVNYKISNFAVKSDPKQAYCRFDDTVIPASKVTTSEITCPKSDHTFTKLAVSFDMQSWSKITMVEESSNVSGFIILVVGIIIGVVGVTVGAGIFFFKKNQAKSNRPSTAANSKPLAYFPTVEDGEKKPSYY